MISKVNLETTMENELPPESERLAAFVDQQPPRVREAFDFLLAVALEESGKAKLINTSRKEGLCEADHKRSSRRGRT